MAKLKIDGLSELAVASQSSANAVLGQLYQDMWQRQRRMDLLRAKPEALNSPVYETLSREMIHDDYGKGEPLEDYIAKLREIAANAPEGAPVFVAIDEEGDYEGGSYYYLRVGCERPPTAEEVEARRERNAEILKVHEEAAAETAEKERSEFERLKAKFGK